MKYSIIILYLIYFAFQIPQCTAKTGSRKLVLDNIVDIKDFKKLIRTKTNVLVCFYNSYKQSQNVIKVFKEVADNIKGEGTMALVDCSGEAKKMCKKLKIPGESYILKHYKDGDFNKDYDRKLTVSSMTNFMRDPTGDLPWEEDTTAMDVVHIPDANTLNKFLKKEAKPILLMFFAPWCGFCKTLKPEYAEAATELKNKAALAAIDVNRPENTVVRSQYNITGFPTLLYFENGQMKYTYEGENKKKSIVEFMHNPSAPPIKIKEPEWSDTDSEVVHLTSSSFDPVIKEESSVLVMFYAPWCGHCKKMKPEYEAAAAQMKSEGIQGMLAAVDATKEQSVASRYSVKGYPTIMYFSYGEQKFDVNVREAPKIIEFMQNPREPPLPRPPERLWSEDEGDVVHLTEQNFRSFLRKKKHVLVIFYAPWCAYCRKTKPEFVRAAMSFRDDPKVEFAAVDCTANPDLCVAHEVKGYPTLKYYSYYARDTKTYNGGRTILVSAAWIVVEVVVRTFETCRKKGIKIRKITVSCTENGGLLVSYPYEPYQEFIDFMTNPENVANTSANPPPPQSDQWKIDSSILNLTDSNFQQKLQENNVVLVMFYAPWCGHCRNMKPTYMAAAKLLQQAGYTSCMAMVDCSANPMLTEQYNISGFPTVKLFKNGKYIQDYTGKRTVDDIKNFVLPHFNSNKKDEL